MTPNPAPDPDLQRLRARLHAVRRQSVAVWSASTVFGFLGVAASLLLIALLLDRWLVLPAPARLGLLLIVLAGTAAVLLRALRERPRASAEDIALRIEHEFPELDNVLINSLQLASRPDDDSRPFVQAITHDARLAFEKISPGKAVTKRWLLLGLGVTTLAAAAFALHASRDPAALRTGLGRVLSPLSHNTLTRIVQVTPGDSDLPAQSDCTITAMLAGVIPTQGRLVVTRPDSSSFEIPLTPPSTARPDRLAARIDRVEGDLTYRVLAGDDASPIYTLRVHQRPAIQRISHTLTPPPYIPTRPPPVVGGSIQGVTGSAALLTLTSSQPLSAGVVRLADDRAVKLDIDPTPTSTQPASTRASATLPIDHAGPYTIELTSTHGFDSEPIRYDITLLDDRPPTVEFVSPRSELAVAVDATVAIEVQAVDDFAVREVVIDQLEPTAGSDAPALDAPARRNVLRHTLDKADQPRVNRTVNISVAELGLTEKAPIVLRAQARDFRPDAPAGFAPPLVIRLKAEPQVKPQNAIARISLDALIAKQRANLDATDAAKQANKPAPADLAALTRRQEEIRGDAVALAMIDSVNGNGTPNPDLQKKLHDLAASLMVVAIEQLRAASSATTDRADPLNRAAFTQRAILKELIAADARQDQEIAERRRREIADGLADVLAREQALRKDADRRDLTGPALAARQSVIARDAARLARQIKAEADTGAAGNPELAQRFEQVAQLLEQRAVRPNMLIAAERLEGGKRPEAATLQDKIIADLAEAQKILRQQALTEASKELEDARTTLADAAKRVDKMAEMQKAVTELARQLQKSKDLRDGRTDAAEKLEDYKEAKKNLADAIEQLVKDLHLLPDMSASNDLLAEASEIYEDVKQTPGSEKQEQAEEVAVTRDEGTLAALKAMQKKMGERIGDLEMWLMPKPDAVRFKQESWDKNEIGKVPLGDLPDELEDIVGKLVEKSEKLQKDAQDSASNVGLPDAVMGWDIADGPMPSWAAKGKSGNEKPNDNEQTGRSGSGRQGKSSGEVVGDTVKNLKGADVEARRTNDGFQAGELKEEKGDAMDVKATGGGKLAGVSPNEGMSGDAPPRNELKYRDMVRQHQQMKRDAETVYSKAKLLKLPTGELDRAVLELDAAARRLNAGDIEGFRKAQDAVVRALKQTHDKLSGVTVVQAPSPTATRDTNTAGATGEPIPSQYEDAVARYMRRIAGGGE